MFATPKETNTVPSARVGIVHAKERSAGLDRPEAYGAFTDRVAGIKRDLLRTLTELRQAGRTVAAYGAPAKGNTLLNYCGIDPDLVNFTVDRNPHKQGHWLPGSRIPICEPDRLRHARPDYLLILPWNLKDEIMQSCSFIREWGGQFILPIPEVAVVP